MVQVILVMHQPLGEAFARCAEHVLGGSSPLQVFDIAPDADIRAVGDELVARLLTMPHGGLVLCDLYGATPFNIARRAVAHARCQGACVELLAGANLNMVLKAVTDRITEPAALADSVRRGALRGIICPQLGESD